MGKLERGWLRDLWNREDSDFTPWLARDVNISLLAEALNLEQLDEVKTEVPVGDFRLDILARDTQSGTLVAVENQFWTGDHKHLGQLLTYAAGVSGHTSERKLFVWIAEEIKEEHRSALDWLNRITEPNLGFFGIELELWRIGGSPFAPKFNIVSSPNKWQKQLVQETTVLSPTYQLYLDFWQAFIEFCGEKTTLQLPKPLAQHWMETSVGRSGFGVNLNAGKRAKKLECHLWIDHSRAKDAFAALLKERDIVVNALGSQVGFEEMAGKQACKIFETSAGDVADREQWPTIHSWLKERGEAYVAVFTPLVKQISWIDQCKHVINSD